MNEDIEELLEKMAYHGGYAEDFGYSMQDIARKARMEIIFLRARLKQHEAAMTDRIASLLAESPASDK